MRAAPLESKRLPTSEAEKSAIHEQLGRLLQDPQFKNSKRYPSFLRFVVTKALQGESDSIKERVLGVEVFGKSPDYDSTQDPIVRVTAAEIRKRIVKYYEDSAHRGEIRVLLPLGTYVPVFEFPTDFEKDETAGEPKLTGAGSDRSPDVLEPLPGFVTAPVASAAAWYESAKVRWMVATVVVLLLICAGLFAWRERQKTALSTFWAPLMGSNSRLLFCIADRSTYDSTSDARERGPAPDTNAGTAPTLVTAEDTMPLLEFVSLLRLKTESFHIQVEGRTNLSDLAQGPSILTGAFSNKWTIFATDTMRYRFRSDAEYRKVWIEDRQNPDGREWVSDPDHLSEGPRKDYAIVARFLDPKTGQYTVIVAGLGHHGTTAACNFVLSARELAQLDRAAGPGWRGKNLEIILETVVVNGHPGTAHIDAVETW